jgi:hypothetical protein
VADEKANGKKPFGTATPAFGVTSPTRQRKLNIEALFGGYRVSEIFFVVEEAVEGGFTARALNESIFTEADTLDEIRRNVREAVECHFDDGSLPKVIRLHIVREEILTA